MRKQTTEARIELLDIRTVKRNKFRLNMQNVDGKAHPVLQF